MRADNHPICIDAVDRVGNADATLLELGNNTGIMDERPKCIPNRPLPLP